MSPDIFPDFDSFCTEGNLGIVKYNNFWCCFFARESMAKRDYFDRPECSRFRKEHPNISSSLIQNIDRHYSAGSIAGEDWQEKVEPLLWIAYKCMETYKEVQELLANDQSYLTR